MCSSDLQALEVKTKSLEDLINQNNVHETKTSQVQEAKTKALENQINLHSAHCGYQKGSFATKTSFPRAGSTIPYSSLLVDTGVSHLDIATGVWTAGVSGIYSISWSLSSGLEGGEDTAIFLYRDGEVMAETEHYSASFTDSSVETWDQGGVNMVLALTSGQTLELRTGDPTDSVLKVTFCVTLVHATP